MTPTRFIALLLVVWHGSECFVAGTKVKGVRRGNNNEDSQGASELGNAAVKARHQILKKFSQKKRLLQTKNSRDEAGFLSSGFFGSFSDFRGPNEDGSFSIPGGSASSTTTTATTNAPATRENTRDGSLTSYGSYYGGLGHAFQGGFPIRCR